ncbi:RNA-directed DNA polymerase [Persicimonas caeni]|uniref:RNA-directed DNA polymerase n=1 Tax=Persicimonas caeni TaxID=2292766 RepID=A0A4Y6PXV0_PERCE|nr:reverse transcriptase family protein [Persicimonas caeni]QDG53070.1 RNA-directed DNA polymerase [Persicimonas caeni]QED34292.1 RNA-directed DNA polymerase [Persicimonas caeni]
MTRPSREELYRRIRESSKDSVILDEMLRLGFWDSEEGANDVPEELIRREAELRQELRKLTAQQRRYENRDAALKAMRKERLRESREKRAANKQRRKEERLARAMAWDETQKTHIVYLGEDVSTHLEKLDYDAEKLAKHALPDFPDHVALADALGVSMAELRFLAYHREVSTVTHYRRFQMPKKRGGFRNISAPMPRLKRAQTWILENILDHVPLRDEAHGFRPSRSIVSNARPHVGQDVVINMDVKDFFPTVTLWRVFGVFESLGYSPSVATILALLCTELPVEELELDGKTWYVATGERCLPQGGPTSPAITNILCRRMDARLAGIADKHGFVYTRYADDLTFSASGEAAEAVTKLLWHVKTVVQEEGFELHPDKQRIMRSGRRQEVTGLVVNDRLSVPRDDVRAFRALLHRVKTAGLERAHWKGESDNLLDRIHGFASFVHMVDAERYAELRAEAKEVLDAHGYAPQPVPPKPKSERQDASAEGDGAAKPKKGLWAKIKGFFAGAD